MKCSILVGTLALGLAVGSPSFGAGLLDRILTTKGCGCETKPVQKCGAEKGKPVQKRGAEKGKPKAVATPRSKAKGKGGNLLQDLVGQLHLNVGHHGKSKAKCGTAKPKRVAKGGNLLQDLVGHLNLNVGHNGKSKAKCGSAKPKRVAKSKSKCGCSGNSNTAPTAEAHVSPLPPAPIVDPSAFLDRRNRTVTASYVR